MNRAAATAQPEGLTAIRRETVATQVAFVGEYRKLYGVRAARALWRDLNLPAPEGFLTAARMAPGLQSIAEFLDHVGASACRVSSLRFGVLREAYARFCAQRGVMAASDCLLGRELAER